MLFPCAYVPVFRAAAGQGVIAEPAMSSRLPEPHGFVDGIPEAGRAQRAQAHGGGKMMSARAA
jgi:hypothetical protein